MEKVKLYCYVDETGQDTGGTFFLVSVILSEQSQKNVIEPIIVELEKKTGKEKIKWSRTPLAVKKKFLEGILKIKELKQSIFYSVYLEKEDYNMLTSRTIVKAIEVKQKQDYFVLIVVDALTKKSTEKMRIVLKRSGVKYKNIRGMKDEQSVFLRLADAIAGFVRDYTEGKPYTKVFFDELRLKGFVEEV